MWPCLFVVVVFVVLVLALVVILFLKLFLLQEAKPGHRRARVARSRQEGAHLRRKVENSRVWK